MEIRFFVLCLPLLLRTEILESVVKTFNIYRIFQYSLSWNLNPALMFCDSRLWYGRLTNTAYHVLVFSFEMFTQTFLKNRAVLVLPCPARASLVFQGHFLDYILVDEFS